MSYSLFISDLHLLPNDRKSELFISFLEKYKKCDKLFILGDLFDFYTDDSVSIKKYQNIINAIKNLSLNSKIFVLRGNRDFLIAKKFAEQTNAIVIIKTPYEIVINNQKYLLIHGDELCTDDKSYQIYKKIVQSLIFRCIYYSFSKKIQFAIVKIIRKTANFSKTKKNYAIMDVNQSVVDKLMAKYPNYYLIHGHTHRKNIHIEKFYTRYVLGDWSDNVGNALKISTEALEPEWLSIY